MKLSNRQFDVLERSTTFRFSSQTTNFGFSFFPQKGIISPLLSAKVVQLISLKLLKVRAAQLGEYKIKFRKILIGRFSLLTALVVASCVGNRLIWRSRSSIEKTKNKQNGVGYKWLWLSW